MLGSWKTFSSKIICTFENGDTKEIVGADKLLSIDYKLEMAKDNVDSLGEVSPNEVYIKILDLENLFISKQLENFKIECYISVDNNGEWVRRGVFYNDKVNINNNTRNTVDITGIDIIGKVMDNVVKYSIIEYNIGLKDYISKVMYSIYGDESLYSIDESLNGIIIKNAYINKGTTARDFYNSIGQAYRLAIFTNINGVIEVSKIVSYINEDDIKIEFDGATNLFQFTRKTDKVNTYNGVRLTYENISKEYGSILSLQDVDIKAGMNTLKDIQLDENKIALDFKVCKVKDCDLVGLTGEPWSATLVIDNKANSDIKTTIELYGNILKINGVTVDRKIEGISNDKLNYKNIDIKFIQDNESAISLSDSILKYYNSDTILEVRSAGHPLLELGDKVTINSELIGETVITGIISRIITSGGICSYTIINSIAIQ